MKSQADLILGSYFASADGDGTADFFYKTTYLTLVGDVAGRGGFEPPTFRLAGGYSFLAKLPARYSFGRGYKEASYTTTRGFL